MGNSTSNAANSDLSHHNPRRTQSPASIPSSRGGSPAPNGSVTQRVHKSLRTKKKSLELPDLASLALTPASSGSPNSSPHAAFRRPRASSPIPIPISPHPPPRGFDVQSNIPSAAKLTGMNGRSRYRSYLSSASAFPSMHSLRSNSREQESAPSDQGSPPRTDLSNGKHDFVQEVVHSTIPLALVKAEGEGPKPEHVTVTIKWREGGRSVILARAGDDYWKGRQPMEYDPETKIWSTQIHVLPGTHHFKFLVDDQWLTSSQYPTAVDDLDGSLANYVSVTSPTSTSPSSTSPQATPHPTNINQFTSSFWSDASSREGGGEGGRGEAAWTTVIPQELIHAAAEEETYLACAGGSPSTSGSVPAPNIPPAPVLPRHLDKLILNVRPQIAGAPGSPGESSRSKKEKEKERSRRERRDREGRSKVHAPSNLGMTTNANDQGGGDGKDGNHLALPVVTPSGTDVTAMYGSSPTTPAIAEREDGGGLGMYGKKPLNAAVNKLVDVLALADDTSVLPVPSHVVLHHLSTSAIKNGVLAVANTTRYKKKYITTIYYKPT